MSRTGRPRKTPEGMPALVHVRVRRDEKAALARAARHAGLSFADYVRAALRGALASSDEKVRP
jgi:uncharacterized protein (DUF1778 family)